jgi:hypothetical protein
MRVECPLFEEVLYVVEPESLNYLSNKFRRENKIGQMPFKIAVPTTSLTTGAGFKGVHPTAIHVVAHLTPKEVHSLRMEAAGMARPGHKIQITYQQPLSKQIG